MYGARRSPVSSPHSPGGKATRAPTAFILSTYRATRTLPARHNQNGPEISYVETLDFVGTADALEREYQARPGSRGKYAIVLSGERDEIVGWGYDAESAIKIAQALNKADKL